MIRPLRALLCLFAGLAIATPLVMPAQAQSPAYQTSVMHWGANTGGFSSWTLGGASLGHDGTVRLDLATATADTDPYPAGSYDGRNFYNGGGYRVGEATSPELPTAFAFTDAIGSWNAETPPGTWVETQIRAWVGDHWTTWYSLGIWAADGATIQRHSVRRQHDADGDVAVDTLALHRWRPAATALQVKVRFFSATDALPSLRAAAVAYSTPPVKPAALTPGDPARWNRILPVPQCSQMVYPDGGEVWCSPTSTSMVLAYWRGDTGPCEPGVRATVGGVFDWSYGGHGNWPFNTAYAAAQGYEGYVVRLESLADAEQWIAAGVPVILSVAWGRGELSSAPIASTSGHLLVLVGFDANGDPVVNDPAGASDAAVQRTYRRSELESLWLEHSGGTAYLIYPLGHPGAVLT